MTMSIASERDRHARRPARWKKAALTFGGCDRHVNVRATDTYRRRAASTTVVIDSMTTSGLSD
jgi:hypothetical protein